MEESSKRFKAGDRVRFLCEEYHQKLPGFYPPVGTIGTVVDNYGNGSLLIQWPNGTTYDDGLWLAGTMWVEKVGADGLMGGTYGKRT